MSHFDAAIKIVLKHEGGFVDNPNDPGGTTNFGVSLRTLRGLGDMDFDIDEDGDIDGRDIALFDVDTAKKFYKKHFWNPKFDDIENEELATKLFDMSVNVGERQAVKNIQHAVNLRLFSALTHSQGLRVDGILGPATLQDVNLCSNIIFEYRAQCAKFYFDLVDKQPMRRFQFLLGWLRRAYS